MSDLKRYLPGSNSGSNKDCDRKTMKGNEAKGEGKEEVGEGNEFVRKEAERGHTVRTHQAAMVLLLALLMFLSVTVPQAMAATDDGSGSSRIGAAQAQSAFVAREEEDSGTGALPMFRSTTFLMRLLTGGNTGWYTSVFSDAGLLQRMWESMNLIITSMEVEPMKDGMIQVTHETSARPRRSSDSNRGDDVEPPPENTNPGDPVEDDTGNPDELDPADPGENVEDPDLADPGEEDDDESNPGGNTGGDTDEPNMGDDTTDGDETDDERVTDAISLELTIEGQGTVTSIVYSDGLRDTGSMIEGINHIEAGSDVTLTAVPADEHVFLYWCLPGVEENDQRVDLEYIVENIQQSLRITAHFIQEPTYVVNLESSNGGSATFHTSHENEEQSLTFKEGEQVTVVATPNDLYRFSHWEKTDAAGTTLIHEPEHRFVMDNGNVEIKAFFAFIHPFEGGTGQEDDPYQIKTAEQLAQLLGNNPQLAPGYAGLDFHINLMEADYQLVGDIDLKNVEWSPTGGSGASSAESVAFTGTFDGNGKTISNLRIDRPSDSYQAMFHTIGVNGKINDLTILDPYVAAKCHGAVLAVNNHGRVEKVLVKLSHTPASPLNEAAPIEGSVIVKIGTVADKDQGNHGAGLIVFNREGGTISQSGVEGVVYADGPGQVSYFGLLSAENMGLIEESYAIGSIARAKSGDLRMQISHNGGLAGINRNGHPNYFNAVIRNSYAIVKFMASSTIQGGIAGTLHRSVNMNNTGAIQKVYAVSDVTENSNTSFGSHTGSINREVTESYYEEREGSQMTNITGVGLSPEDMKLKDRFNNWKFDTIWVIDTTKTINNGYPYLRWQYQ